MANQWGCPQLKNRLLCQLLRGGNYKFINPTSVHCVDFNIWIDMKRIATKWSIVLCEAFVKRTHLIEGFSFLYRRWVPGRMISAGKIDGFWLGFLFSKEKFIYRVSHCKVNKVIWLCWGYKFWFLLIFFILHVDETWTFMPNSSLFIFMMLRAL